MKRVWIKRIGYIGICIILFLIICYIGVNAYKSYSYKEKAKEFLIGACKVEEYFSNHTEQNIKSCFDSTGELINDSKRHIDGVFHLDDNYIMMITVLKYDKLLSAPPIDKVELNEIRLAVDNIIDKVFLHCNLIDVNVTDDYTIEIYKEEISVAKKELTEAIDILSILLDISREEIELGSFNIWDEDVPMDEARVLINEAAQKYN